MLMLISGYLSYFECQAVSIPLESREGIVESYDGLPDTVCFQATLTTLGLKHDKQCDCYDLVYNISASPHLSRWFYRYAPPSRQCTINSETPMRDHWAVLPTLHCPWDKATSNNKHAGLRGQARPRGQARHDRTESRGEQRHLATLHSTVLVHTDTLAHSPPVPSPYAAAAAEEEEAAAAAAAIEEEEKHGCLVYLITVTHPG
jgi:hypothetical protein